MSSFKIVSGDAVHQPTWPLLLKIEHMVKLQVFGNNSKTGKVWNKSKLKCEMIWKKTKLNSEKILKIWKKSKLKCEMIWKIWKKSIFLYKTINTTCNLFKFTLWPTVRAVVRPSSVVRRKLFQKSSPLKVLDQWKPNLVWIITRMSSFKIVSGDAVQTTDGRRRPSDGNSSHDPLGQVS
jgi:hypothetical protein